MVHKSHEVQQYHRSCKAVVPLSLMARSISEGIIYVIYVYLILPPPGLAGPDASLLRYAVP